MCRNCDGAVEYHYRAGWVHAADGRYACYPRARLGGERYAWVATPAGK